MGTYTVESFAPIANHVTETSIVIVRADDDRFPDLEALVAYGKENEGTKNELLASTNGPQASNHIGAQAFANSAGFMYTDIPQGGTADQLLSLRGAEADFSVVKLACLPMSVFPNCPMSRRWVSWATMKAGSVPPAASLLPPV